MNVAAIIVAAGSGDRFGADAPKQFQDVAGAPMVAWSVRRFADSESVSEIVLVVPAGEEETATRINATFGSNKVSAIVAGGETRQASVAAGLAAVGPDATHVLIHDAARPCVSETVVAAVIDALGGVPAVVPAIPAVDTLVRRFEGRVDAIVDRTQIEAVQTPQGFERALVERAHREASSRGLDSSDDGSLVLALGEAVEIVPGDPGNVKVTYPTDMKIAAAILADAV